MSHTRSRLMTACWIATFSIATSLLVAQTPLTADPLPDGSDVATKAIATLKFPSGMKMELFAAEPQLGNPVAICLDELNRVYVAEQYRFNRGTEENRTRPFLLDDDLQLRTTADRLAMFQKFASRFEGGMAWFSKYTDQVRRLEDRNGDGRADRSTIFADGFNGPLDGLAAGLIARDGAVYVTNIPKLWLLKDTNDDGRAEVKQPLLDGFGVNAAFLGHDLHGLVWGPEGKLYFSVGDRGYHVQTLEGHILSQPRRGAVFRCDPDGRHLEVVHIGLRNPQELAFDEYGNLFADDNNCDKGDHSRLVWVVEGGDSGWNMAYQTLAAPYLTGPWHAEKIWHLPNTPEALADQPAWIVPPLGKLGAGPSGFVYYPGTGLSERYQGHFFMCNYTGNGGIESFAVKSAGASFEIVDMHDFVKPLKATDAEFGYDGKMYISDYVNLEWNGGSKGGRIYTLFDPKHQQQPAARQVERLFREGFRQRASRELAELLRHADMRVRQRAQFALAERGESSMALLTAAVEQTTSRFQRLHGIWGLGQIARTERSALTNLTRWLDDQDPEVRTQAIKTLGALRADLAAETITQRLSDTEPRVRFHAAIAVGQLKHRAAVPKLFECLQANANQDLYLRHAYVEALTRIHDRDAVLARAKDPHPAVRLGVALTLRRWQDSAIAQLLSDADIKIVTEAARAINDLPLDDATAALAAVAERLEYFAAPWPDALVRRVINANFRLDDADSMRRLAQLASQAKLSDVMRREALLALRDWVEPPPRDRVNGNWRPLSVRDAARLRAVLQPLVPALLASASSGLQADVADLITKLNLQADDQMFVAWARDVQQAQATRLAALELLAKRKHVELDRILEQCLRDSSPELRARARRLLALADPARGVKALRQVIEDPQGVTSEQQAAVLTLADLATSDADRLMEDLLQRWLEARLPQTLQLDVWELAQRRSTTHGKALVERIEKSWQGADPLARYNVALLGGQVDRGRELFISHPGAQCIRCHKIELRGGDAGPDLSKVATRGDRLHLLQSLIAPSAKIAPGFGTVTLALSNGTIVGGMLKAESAQSLTLLAPNGQELRIAVSDIDERSAMQSSMPVVTNALSLREIRDLVEYLSTLK